MAEIIVTGENFENEVLKSDRPVLLDFWAQWCGPCKMISPLISEIAEEYSDSVKVGKVDVDEQPELASAFGISSIPTVVLMKEGKVADHFVGYRSKAEIEKMLG